MNRVPSASRDASRLAPGLKSPDCWVPPSTPGCCPAQLSTHVSHQLSSEASEHDQGHSQLPPGEDPHDEHYGPELTDQSTLQGDERLGLSFMDAHGYSPRGECLPLPCGPQALLPQIPEPTAQRPPSVDSVTPRTTGLSILLGTSMGPGDTEKAPVLSLHWRSFRKIEVLDADSSKRSVSCLVNCEKCSGDSGKGVLLWGQSHLLPAV